MRIIFFDTETNGLPHVKKAPVTIVENWPRIVSIAWQLCERTQNGLNVLEQKSFLVKPPSGIEWDTKSQELHGISFEMATNDGTNIDTILKEFQKDCGMAGAIVAHNLEFDKPILQAEFLRLKQSLDWWPTFEFCTMKHATPICKIPGRYPKPNDPYKYPSLKELYSHLFGNIDTSIILHTANGDVELLVQIFRELLRRDLVLPKDFPLPEARLDN